MSEFDALLGELATLSKAMPAMDDKNITAAAGDEQMGEDGKPLPKKPVPTEDDGSADMEMGKSLRVRLADGSEVEGIDGTDLVKSLMVANETLAARVDKLSQALGATVEIVKGLHGTGHAHAGFLKSMTADLATLGNQGSGRRTTLTIHERAAAPTAPAASRDEIMSKALSAQTAGRLDAHGVARVEHYVMRGLEMPADLTKALTA